MATKVNNATLAFNRGLLSRLGLARVDLARSALSAEVMTNWVARALGSMMLRPGLEYIGTPLANATAKNLSFIYSQTDKAQIELTSGQMRVRIDDVLVTRPVVSATVLNGNFTTDLTGWTDSDESGGASSWSAGTMALLGNGTDAAIRDQLVSVFQPGVEHALRLVVTRGPVILRVGSSLGTDNYISETTLDTGTHSLAFTPTGNFSIRLQSRVAYTTYVDSVQIEATGVMTVPTPWTDLTKIRAEQSGDVVFVAAGIQQYKIERRAAHSWSVVVYQSNNGPFRAVNTTPITIQPSALTGDITLLASAPLFRSTNVGSLYRIQSTGQIVAANITGANQFSAPIRVTGVEAQRAFGVTITGTFVATFTLQYSVGEPGSWVDVKTWTAPTSESYDDGLDNQVIFYRIGIKPAAYTSGSADVGLQFTSGSITGVVRITAVTDAENASAVVLTALGATSASSDWWEGSWSDRRGWPSAVALFEGRLWWAGNDKVIGSVSDAYYDFDDTVEGDSGPISRSIGQGPVESINWLMPLNRLMVGTLSNSAAIPAIKLDGNNVLSGRSSSFDEPLTPTNFNLKSSSAGAIYVQRSKRRVMSLNFDINEGDYKHDDLTIGVPDLNEVGIAGLAASYSPDTRVYAWRADGLAALLVFDRGENVICWSMIETDGLIEDISVMPSDDEDRVYFVVNRGGTRYIEKMALESECRGGLLNKQADSFVVKTGLISEVVEV